MPVCKGQELGMKSKAEGGLLVKVVDREEGGYGARFIFLASIGFVVKSYSGGD